MLEHRDPLKTQQQQIDCFKARKRFDNGQYSEMIMYREMYIEGQRYNFSRQWMEKNCISSHRFQVFLLTIRKYARGTTDFLQEHNLSEAMHIELCKLQGLAKQCRWTYDFKGNVQSIFHFNVNTVKLAITAAFAEQLIIGRTATTKHADNEVQELEKAGLAPASSLILSQRGPNSTPMDLEKLTTVLRVRALNFESCCPNLELLNWNVEKFSFQYYSVVHLVV